MEIVEEDGFISVCVCVCESGFHDVDIMIVHVSTESNPSPLFTQCLWGTTNNSDLEEIDACSTILA